MSLTDRQVNNIIGDIDTSEEIEYHESEDKAFLYQMVKEMVEDADSEEDLQVMVGEFLDPFREFIDLEELDPNDPDDEYLLRAFELVDERKQT